MERFKKFLQSPIPAVLAVLLCLAGCGQQAAETPTASQPPQTASDQAAPPENASDHSQPQKVLVTMEDGKTFTIETAPQYAPETVDNFLNLVESGFYDGLTFHRIAQGFVAQGGDPKGNGTGGSGKTLRGEFASNGFSQNTLSHTRGVVSMARSNDKNSASSQFFICYDAAPHLDGDYAAFGMVIEGMETVDAFQDVPRDATDKPETPIVIQSMKVIS